MLRPAPNQARRQSPKASCSTRTVCVVDAQPADYQSWLQPAQAAGVELTFVADASAALRLARTHAIDLWVVNTALPGLSGGELCKMLRNQPRRPTVALVADCSDEEVERTAWAAQPSLFICKPAHASLLADWLTRTACHSQQPTTTLRLRRAAQRAS